MFAITTEVTQSGFTAEASGYDLFFVDVPDDLVGELLFKQDVFFRVQLILRHGIFPQIALLVELAAPHHTPEAGRASPLQLGALAKVQLDLGELFGAQVCAAKGIMYRTVLYGRTAPGKSP